MPIFLNLNIYLTYIIFARGKSFVFGGGEWRVSEKGNLHEVREMVKCGPIEFESDGKDGVTMTVSERFDSLVANLTLTSSQREDGQKKHRGVRSTLNLHYYSRTSETDNSMLVGSWGKCTEIRPPRDVDILFVLPQSVYDRFQYVTGNKQSQILQEVKRVLLGTYPNTDIRGDGPTVVVPFTTYAVEVLPAFRQYSGQYTICVTSNGGSYKTVDPNAEEANVKISNDATNGNTRKLIRMLKRWQECCSVSMKSFWLELLAINFIGTWEYRTNSSVYHDYMVRDFFRWLSAKGQSSYNSLIVPGTYSSISIGNDWASKADSAKGRAEKATAYEADNQPCNAGTEWQKIFGDFIPTC